MKVNTLNNQSAFYKSRLLGSNIQSDIYYTGVLPKSDIKTVDIIGTRRPTPYGISMTKFLTEGLRGYKISVISGLAIGIDSLAHQQALESGISTTAVVPTDLDHIFIRRGIKSWLSRLFKAGEA